MTIVTSHLTRRCIMLIFDFMCMGAGAVVEYVVEAVATHARVNVTGPSRRRAVCRAMQEGVVDANIVHPTRDARTTPVYLTRLAALVDVLSCAGFDAASPRASNTGAGVYPFSFSQKNRN